MHCLFQLHISEQNIIQCSIKNFDTNTEEIITLDIEENTTQHQYPINIEFQTNDILFCQNRNETENNTNNSNNSNIIEFMNEWKQFPNDYKKYQFTFQGIETEAIAEVLFALIINEFKNKITKEYIIDSTIIQIPINDYIAVVFNWS